MPEVDVLIPTCERLQGVSVVLAALCGQSTTELRVVLADQSSQPVIGSREIQALARVIEARGGCFEYHYRPERLGIAEQRDFLFSRACCPNVLFLDDDVFLEPWVVEELCRVLAEEKCGFVGAFPSGLSFRDDYRPQQQIIEFWDGPVRREVVDPEGKGWERAQLHRAANHWHTAKKLGLERPRRYKVAWVASCILYDREKLAAVGGFSFWRKLPRFHSGEEVLVQNLLLRRWGGCGIIPSGAYHLELPSSVLNEEGRVDGHALELLPRMTEELGQ